MLLFVSNANAKKIDKTFKFRMKQQLTHRYYCDREQIKTIREFCVTYERDHRTVNGKH